MSAEWPRRFFKAQLRMGVVVAALAVAASGLTAYGFFTAVRLNSIYAPLVENTMAIQIEGLTAHLLVEEALTGDPSVDVQAIWAHLEEADRCARAMLAPGDTRRRRVQPVGDPVMREDLRRLRAKLAEFRTVAQERLAAAHTSGPGSEIDQHFDLIAVSYSGMANQVADELKEVMAQDLRRFRAVQTAVILGCLFLGVWAGTAFYRYERRRADDFVALAQAKQSLEDQIAERQRAQAALAEAHAHLEDRVAERTAELSAANELLSREIAERRLVAEALRDSERRLRLLSSHLMSAQEAERKRISLELHDEMGQSLAVLKLRLRAIAKGATKGDGGWKQELTALPGYVDKIIDDVHRLSKDLSPSIIEDLGLTAALRYRLDDFAKHFGLAVEAQVADVDGLFPPEARTTVYRILQEALTNVGKHAQAARVRVVIREEEGGVFFEVRDDGVGFDAKRLENRCPDEVSLGLAAMQERVRALGGLLELRTEEGAGTALSFRVPPRKEGGCA